jgi:hypothetical protein
MTGRDVLYMLAALSRLEFLSTNTWNGIAFYSGENRARPIGRGEGRQRAGGVQIA